MKKTPNRVIVTNVVCMALINGISMIMMPIYSHLLGTDVYGQASIYTTWSTVFSIVIGVQLAASLPVAQKDFSPKEQLAYQANGVYLAALMGLGLFALIALLGDSISFLLGLPMWSVLLLAPHGFGLFCVNFLSSKFTYEFKQEKNLLVSVSMSLGAALVSVILILLMPEQFRYMAKVTGTAIPQILCGVIVLAAMLRNVGLHLRKQYVQYTISYGLPLVFSNLCTQIFSSSDKLMLQRLDSYSAVGIYSLAFNFANVVASIWYALNNAWNPFYFQYEKAGDDNVLLGHMKNFVRLFSVLTAGFLLLSPEVYRVFADVDFWTGDVLIPIFVLGFYANFVGCFARNHQYYYKKTKTIATISVASAVVNVILNFALIPYWGGIGAALATMVTQMVSMIVHWQTARRYTSKTRNFPYSYKMFVPYTLLVLLCVLLAYQKNIWYIRWGFGVILGLWMLRKLLKTKQIF